MWNRNFFCALLLLLPLAAIQDTCRRQPPPTAPPEAAPTEPAPSPDESASPLRPHLSVAWEEAPVARLVIEYKVENTGSSPVAIGFRNSGRVCGAVRDADGRTLHEFPQITLQVLGEETFPPGEARRFRYEVPRRELGEWLRPPLSVEAWLCGQPELRRRATLTIPSGE